MKPACDGKETARLPCAPMHHPQGPPQDPWHVMVKQVSRPQLASGRVSNQGITT